MTAKELSFRQALEDWRVQEMLECGMGEDDLFGAQLILMDPILDRIVDLAHHSKITDIISLKAQTDWHYADRFGAKVLAILQMNYPPTSLFTTRPLERPLTNTSSTWIVPPIQSNPVKKPRTTRFSRCGQVGHIVSNCKCPMLRCRDSILYRLVEAYFTAHDHWASQRNITIMYPGHFPALLSIFVFSRIFAFHRASSRSITHHRVLSCIFAFYRTSSRFTVHLRIPSRIFAFHRTSSHSIAHLRVPPHIFAFHRASSRSTAHLRILSCIFAFHRASSRFIAI
ncbi:hypothetical protein BD769DRAFT_1673651 [Suillus cothurnatus]|nr:hypothetical protein BD769DRAFT_1673651 [Suillus cothurnatus]